LKSNQSTCPICNSDDVICYMKKDLSKCLECEHVWQSSLNVTQTYNKDYCTKRYDNESSDKMAYLRAGFVLSCSSLLSGAKISNTRTICDIGYGMGHFLKTIECFDFKTYGIDVHGGDFGIQECNYDSDIHFSVVTMFDSLEHLEDPLLISKMSTDLYIVTLPNTPMDIADFITWKHYRPGEHLHYFSRKSLETTLNSKIISEIDLEDVIRKGDIAHKGVFGNSNTITLILKPNDREEKPLFVSSNSFEVEKPVEKVTPPKELETLTVKTIDGVGDVWWTYNRVKDLAEKIHLQIYMNTFSKERRGQRLERPRRAHQLIEMLPNASYEYMPCTDDDYLRVYKGCAPATLTQSQLVAALRNGSGYSACVNSLMETGIHLQDVWKMPLSYHKLSLEKNANLKLLDSVNLKKLVFLHGATYGNRKVWADMPPDTLASLAKDLSINFGLDIGLIGSEYDNVDWDVLKKKVRNAIGRSPFMLVGEHLSTSLLAIHRSLGWVGPICGVGIVALTMGDPIFALWPKHHHRMVNTISNPSISPNPPYFPFLCENFYKGIPTSDVVSKLRSDVLRWAKKAVDYRKLS